MADSIVGIGLAGVQQGLSNAARDAERVVRAFTPEATEEPIGPLVDLKADQRQVQASAAVIKVGQRLEDAVLDILA